MGQNSCESKNEFLHQDIEGRVIASGNPDDPSKDYAIVKVPLILDITPAIISTEYLSRSLPLITVGFPLKSTYSQKSRFRYPTTSFMKAISLSVDGTFLVTNISDSAGGSGSGIFILDEDNGRPQVVY